MLKASRLSLTSGMRVPPNRQIGEQLFLAEKTVKNYVSSILSKLGLQRRTQAAVFVAKVKSE